VIAVHVHRFMVVDAVSLDPVLMQRQSNPDAPV
jgi:hypothetical protein